MPYAGIIPGHIVLIWLGRVIFIGDVVAEDDIRERLEPMCMAARNIDSEGVLFPDVLAEDVTGLAVQDDDARHAGETSEEIILASLVVMETTNYATPRRRDVRLNHAARQPAIAADLKQPSALVPYVGDANQLDARKRRTHSLTS